MVQAKLLFWVRFKTSQNVVKASLKRRKNVTKTLLKAFKECKAMSTMAAAAAKKRLQKRRYCVNSILPQTNNVEIPPVATLKTTF